MHGPIFEITFGVISLGQGCFPASVLLTGGEGEERGGYPKVFVLYLMCVVWPETFNQT